MRRTILLMLFVLVLSGCSQEAEPIRLGTMPTYSGAIYAVGIEKGFFEEAGVEVEMTVFRSARDRDGAATAGQLDGFMTDIMGAMNLNAKGFPFLITSREYEEFALVAGPGVDLMNLSVPKTGIGENTVVDYIVDAYVTEEVEKVSIPAVPDRMGALLGGELDYGVFPQPFTGIILGNGGQMVLNTAEHDFQPVVLVFDKTFIDENEASVQAFYEGYAKTVAYMKAEDYNDYKEALVTHGLASEDTVDFYRLPVDHYDLNQVSEKDYEATMAWMINRQLLEAPLAMEETVSSSFVK